MHVEPIRSYHDLLRGAPLGRLVTVAGHMLSQRWGRYLAEHHGLTPAGMTVLFTLDRHGESTHRQMAERCFIRPATLTGIVDTLERDGFVERHRDATDRRAVRLALTAKGHEHLRQLSDMIHRNAPLTSVDVDPAKAAVIREFLIQLIDSISEGEDGRVNHHHGEADESGKPGGAAC